MDERPHRRMEYLHPWMHVLLHGPRRRRRIYPMEDSTNEAVALHG